MAEIDFCAIRCNSYYSGLIFVHVGLSWLDFLYKINYFECNSRAVVVISTVQKFLVDEIEKRAQHFECNFPL